MAQNRDRNWQDRDQHQGGQGHRGHYGTDETQGRGFWDRASDEVSSWFGDDEARHRREMDEHLGRGPKGYTRSDERIREDVNDRLTDDGWLDASDIEVQVSSNEVTLAGEVNSRAERRRAEDIVDVVTGVKHMQNNLRVKERSSTIGQASTTQASAADCERLGDMVDCVAQCRRCARSCREMAQIG